MVKHKTTKSEVWNRYLKYIKTHPGQKIKYTKDSLFKTFVKQKRSINNFHQFSGENLPIEFKN